MSVQFTQEAWEWKGIFVCFNHKLLETLTPTKKWIEHTWNNWKIRLSGWYTDSGQYSGYTNAICHQKLWTQRFAHMQRVQICIYLTMASVHVPMIQLKHESKVTQLINFKLRVTVFPVRWFSWQVWKLKVKARISEDRRTKRQGVMKLYAFFK